MVRCSPRSELTSELFPTFGRPTMASASSVSPATSSSSGGRPSTIASSKSPVPSPWIAETEARELAGDRHAHAFGFGFVRNENDRAPRLAHDGDDVVVERRKPGGCV